MRDDTKPARRGRTVLLLAATAAMLAILLSLGTWQVQRLYWKEDLIARIEERIHREPMTLAELNDLAAGEGDLEYRPATVRGRFLHDREMFLLATYKGQSGWHVYTPLELAEGQSLALGVTMIVNRGFVPFDRRDPATRPGSQPLGTVSITGLVRETLSEKPSFIVPDNEPGEGTYYWKDWATMVGRADLDASETIPFFLDAGESGPGTLPVGGVTRIALPNNHLQYAITWYGLAAALAGVAGVFLWRRWRA